MGHYDDSLNSQVNKITRSVCQLVQSYMTAWCDPLIHGVSVNERVDYKFLK